MVQGPAPQSSHVWPAPNAPLDQPASAPGAAPSLEKRPTTPRSRNPSPETALAPEGAPPLPVVTLASNFGFLPGEATSPLALLWRASSGFGALLEEAASPLEPCQRRHPPCWHCPQLSDSCFATGAEEAASLPSSCAASGGVLAPGPSTKRIGC